MQLHFTKTTDKFTVRLNIEADKMKMFLDVEPVGPQVLTRAELLDSFKEAVDIEKVDARVIDDILEYLKNGEVVEDRRILKGTPPQDGADGKLVLTKKKYSGDVEVAIDKRGYANYKELNLFDNIVKEDIVGKLHPPQKGTDGLDVLGKPVPSKPGKQAKATVDKSISLRPSPDPKFEYQVLVSEANGYLFEESGRLSIKGELVVSGDLDLRYGNIDFVGALKVTGDVTPGLTLQAKQGISVTGSLTGSKLISSEGDINVKGFFYGGPQSMVSTPKNFNATVTHAVNAETGGDIVVSKEAIDCNFRTRASVLMLKGRLVGGETLVSRGVEAKYIGSEANNKTVIRLCNDIEITTEYSKLETNLRTHDKSIELLQIRLGPYANNPQRIELLNSPQKIRMKDALSKLKLVSSSKEKLVEKKTTMLEGAKSNDIIRINFLSKLYRGVEVIAGESVFSPEEDLEGPASLDYIVASKAFELGELKPLGA